MTTDLVMTLTTSLDGGLALVVAPLPKKLTAAIFGVPSSREAAGINVPRGTSRSFSVALERADEMTNLSEGSIGCDFMSTNDDPPGRTGADEGAWYDSGGGSACKADVLEQLAEADDRAATVDSAPFEVVDTLLAWPVGAVGR